MSGINNEYKIYLKVLTPLHIGGQQEKNLMEGIDTLFVNNKLWKINWNKVYAEFSPDEISEAILRKDGLYDLLHQDIELFGSEYSEGLGDTGETKTIIRDGLGRTFIPGSSIKGALKNWLSSAWENNKNGTKNLLGNFETDLFHFIKTSDCYISDIKVFPAKTFNLHEQNGNWAGGWKHSLQNNTNNSFSSEGFVTDYECFSIDASSQFKLKIESPSKKNFEEKLFDSPIRKLKDEIERTFLPDKKKKLENKLKPIENGKKVYDRFYSENNNPIQTLFSNVNHEVIKHLKKEITFFETFETDRTEEIISQIDRLIAFSKDIKNACILRLSAGSGFHGITGDFQFVDHTKTGVWNYGKNKGKMKYKSRKIAFTSNEMFPMGFVLLSTEPFEEKESTVLASADQPLKREVSNQPTPQKEAKSVVAEKKDASQVKKGDIVFGKITQIGKPFCSVKLLLTNYDFGDADLSGTKKYPIEIGQIVKCQLGDSSADGEFKQVRFVP